MYWGMTEKQSIPLWELVVFVIGLLVAVFCFHSDPPLIFPGLIGALVVSYIVKNRWEWLGSGNDSCNGGGG